MSQKELAEAFGKSTRQIRNWEADGLPVRAEGNRKFYPLAAAVAFYRDIEVEKAIRASSTDEMDAARLRKLEAEADAKELDLAVKRNELVPMDEVEDLLRDSLETIDSVMKNAPSRFAPALAKIAGVPLKRARTILEDVVELVRGSVREIGSEKSA